MSRVILRCFSTMRTTSGMDSTSSQNVLSAPPPPPPLPVLPLPAVLPPELAAEKVTCVCALAAGGAPVQVIE
jgi:hypothetical protein